MMVKELGQISFYLAKKDRNFESVVHSDKIPAPSASFKTRDFEVDGVPVRFFCVQSTVSNSDNPPWLDFVNQEIDSEHEKVHFPTHSTRPSGLLLLSIDGRILAATFGTRSQGWLDKGQFLPDFGIKTAMNMCGNKELRQTKSRTHAITTQHIDRQLSRPSDAFSFGLGETEFLQFISAQLEKNKNVTLQGKGNLTIKTIGDEKLSWERLIEFCRTFVTEYEHDRYKELFPNYPNLENVSDERGTQLDELLIENLRQGDFSCIHLAIPEFISDDRYSFSYTNYPKKPNNIYSHIDIEHLASEGVLKLDQLEVERLKSKHVYAYSAEEDRILEYRKWSLYSCIVAEVEVENQYFVLSDGVWRKVDDEFYASVNAFVDEVIPELEIDEQYRDVSIFDASRNQNREEVFNADYCQKNELAILFDKAKLRIGQGAKNNEFCDILEFVPDEPARIVHVKKQSGSSSLNHLFSQARYYCEFFLRDQVFLSEIRGHIQESDHAQRNRFLDHVKACPSEVYGGDYAVELWILFDRLKPPPKKADLPLMAKFELKITYERLRNIQKYSSVVLRQIPVAIVDYKAEKKSD